MSLKIFWLFITIILNINILIIYRLYIYLTRYFFDLIQKINYKILNYIRILRDYTWYTYIIYIGKYIVQSIYLYIDHFNYLLQFLTIYFNNYNSSSNKFNNESINNNYNKLPDNDHEDDDNKSITIKIERSFKKLYPLNVNTLLSKPIKIFYNALLSKNNIIKDYKNVSGIYLLHNSINGKQYIGSGYNLSVRLSSYYYPSKLLDRRHISNSILKYGHDNFSIVILDILGFKDSIVKVDLIKKEQYYIDLYKPALNINTIAGSTLGFIHTDETKKIIAEFRKGKNLSKETRHRLSILFSGELNPFWGKTHNINTLDKMKKSKLGKLNPMFNKEKSKEFIEQMYKDKSGINNPMYGKTHNTKTLEKLRKKVYVYNSDTKELEKVYEGIVIASKDLKISYETLRKYCKSNEIYKNKIFSLNPLNF